MAQCHHLFTESDGRKELRLRTTIATSGGKGTEPCNNSHNPGPLGLFDDLLPMTLERSPYRQQTKQATFMRDIFFTVMYLFLSLLVHIVTQGESAGERAILGSILGLPGGFSDSTLLL